MELNGGPGSRDGRPVVLIPAYNPDGRLLDLLARLKPVFPRIVLVNDGSTSGAELFAQAQPLVEKVLVHERNRGKGAALKTGFAYVGDGADIITADADGQHTPEDIERVAEGLKAHRGGLVLGVRAFTGKVPFRSRLGNFFTRWLFFVMTGMMIRDTQTGLRGIPAGLVKRLLAIGGDRYEYEMAVLADAKRHAERPLQIPIATIYTDGNKTSHFKPVLDTIRIYRSLFQFCVSSVLAFVIDNVAFAAALRFMAERDTPRREDILVAITVARLLSAHFNYLYNRFVVFRSRGTHRGHYSYLGYAGLMILIGAASWGLTGAASALLDARGSAAITAVKIVMDTVLFGASYWVQKRFVFRGCR